MSPRSAIAIVAVFVAVALAAAIGASLRADARVAGAPAAARPRQAGRRLVVVERRRHRHDRRRRRRRGQASQVPEVAEGDVAPAAPSDGRRVSQPDGGDLCTRAAEIVLPVVLRRVACLLVARARAQWFARRLLRRRRRLSCSRAVAWPRDPSCGRRQIRNGLPDALDLLIVCLEAGCEPRPGDCEGQRGADVAYPALAEELQHDDHRDPRRASRASRRSRTSRRGRRSTTCGRWWRCWCRPTGSARASRRRCARTPKRRAPSAGSAPRSGPRRSASSWCFRSCSVLFPALYVVILGPAVIRFVRVFMEQAMQGTLQ